MTPTRELAFQIDEQIKALGSSIGIKTCVIVGGVDMMGQSIILAKKPHVIVATPGKYIQRDIICMATMVCNILFVYLGRLVDHLEKTKGFSLRTLKYLVMDEADRILNMDFESEVDKILKVRLLTFIIEYDNN